MRIQPALLIVGLLAAMAPSARAEEVTVKMLNSGAEGPMVFEPALVKVKPGDTVKFVATDQGHNVETIKGMAPEGTAPVKSKINQDQTITFDKEGVYGFKCAPHYAMGMVALVVVGSKLDNLDQAKAASVPGGAKKRLEPLLAQAQ